MSFKMKACFAVLFFCFCSSSGHSQTPVVPAQNDTTAADDYYHKALDAYLDGNYDQAILLTAQSLEKDPGYQKSKNLLSVLTSEKDQEGKTVIWLSGKPVVSPVNAEAPATQKPSQDTAALKEEVSRLQAKFNVFYSAQFNKNAQMNGQINVIQDLVKENSASQYEELKRSQAEIFNKVQKIDAARGHDLGILYLLCITSVLFSVLAVLRNVKKIKQSSR